MRCFPLPKKPTRTPRINDGEKRYTLSQTLHVAVGRENALLRMASSVKENTIHLEFVQNETDRQQHVQLLVVATLQEATDQSDELRIPSLIRKLQVVVYGVVDRHELSALETVFNRLYLWFWRFGHGYIIHRRQNKRSAQRIFA